MPIHCTRGLRLALFLLLGALALLAAAQSTLTPRWTLAGWPYPFKAPQYSESGERLLVWGKAQGNGSYPQVRVYSVADGQILAQVNLDTGYGALTGACLSPSGEIVYLGTDHGLVFKYVVATRTLSDLPPREQQGEAVTALVVSKDGKLLAYQAGDKDSSYGLVCVYNLETGAEKQFAHTNAGNARLNPDALAFANDGARIVAGGPTLYDLSGVKLKQATFYSDPFVVSPNGRRVYASRQSTVYAYDATLATSGLDYPSVWSKSAPAGATALCGVSSDNAAVVLAGSGSGVWKAAGLRAADGAVVASPYVTSSTLSASFVALSPASNRLCALTPTLAQVWEFDPTSGSGTFRSALFDGVASSPDPDETQAADGSAAFAQNETHAVASRVLRRSGSDQRLGVLPPEAHPSPSGQYYVVLSPSGPFATPGTGVNVYPADGGASVASIHLDANYSRVVWGGSSRFVVTNGTRAQVLDFDASTIPGRLSERASFSLTAGFFGGGEDFDVSDDGTRYCVWTTLPGGNCKVYRADDATLIVTIPKETGSMGIDSAVFVSANRLGVHEVIEEGGGAHRNRFRVFDVVGSSANPQGGAAYPIAGPFDGAAGSLAPDGATIVLGHTLKGTSEFAPLRHSSIRLYGLAGGNPSRQWDDQLLPDMVGAGTFRFSLDARTVRWTTQGSLIVASTGVSTGVRIVLEHDAVPMGGSTLGTVVLASPAETDLTARISVKDGTEAEVSPSTVRIAKGATVSEPFQVRASSGGQTSATIVADVDGATVEGVLRILVPSIVSVEFSPSRVSPGGSSTGTITLSEAAPEGGLTVRLESSHPEKVRFPSASPVTGTVVVAAGQKTHAFAVEIDAASVDAEIAVRVTAKSTDIPNAQAKEGTLIVAPPSVASFTLSRTSVIVGESIEGTVVLSARAPTGGALIGFSFSKPFASVGSLPIRVNAGETTVKFPIKGIGAAAPERVTITASHKGSSQQADLTVAPFAVKTFVVDPAKILNDAGGTVRITVMAAPAADRTIGYASSAPKTVPNGSVTIKAGELSGTASFKTPVVSKDVPVTFTLTKPMVGEAKFAIVPLEVDRVVLSRSSVVGGSDDEVKGTVTLTGTAPKGGAKVVLTMESKPAAGTIVVPGATGTTVTIKEGERSAEFTVAHKLVAVLSPAKVYAQYLKTAKVPASLEVKPYVLTLTIPSSASVGNPVTATVKVSPAAPTAGLTISLSASNATLPKTVTIPSKGTVSPPFTVTFKKKSKASVTATIVKDGTSVTVPVTVN